MLSSYTWGLDISHGHQEDLPDEVKINLRGKKLRDRLGIDDEIPHFQRVLNHIISNINPIYHDYASRLNIDWNIIPPACAPRGGLLPEKRIHRKEQQVESLIRPILDLIKVRGSNITVVEFCAGSGFVILPLAAMFPSANFVLIDAKSQSIAIARRRISDANLKNVQVIDDGLKITVTNLILVLLCMHVDLQVIQV